MFLTGKLQLNPTYDISDTRIRLSRPGYDHLEPVPGVDPQDPLHPGHEAGAGHCHVLHHGRGQDGLQLATGGHTSVTSGLLSNWKISICVTFVSLCLSTEWLRDCEVIWSVNKETKGGIIKTTIKRTKMILWWKLKKKVCIIVNCINNM